MLAVGYEDGIVCILLSDTDKADSTSLSQYAIRCQFQVDQVPKREL